MSHINAADKKKSAMALDIHGNQREALQANMQTARMTQDTRMAYRYIEIKHQQ